MAELDEGLNSEPPIWAIFGDLMTGLVGVFVLLLVWTLGFQLELSQSLEKEIAKREAEQQRRIELEEALADPLAQGRVTLKNGRIGISGSVLFSLNSAELQPEGRKLLVSLMKPLTFYLGENDQLLMVSGFTDDLPIQQGNLNFEDNWELSAQRALTVTRALIEAGMPRGMVFAAAFGAQQPVVPNHDASSRAQNRRVEMAPVPRAEHSADGLSANEPGSSGQQSRVQVSDD
ncbi:OmpA family [Spongiibacter sp. IMCC21906]|uniref:OmpA family protein n=1 Tax=Spongiibacter sp. IMCC21906 TaxID=1620392 RepID=UPI00062DDB7C|nr:OmpA family protein [Spongiibacter sp. IMCC21906]AKH70694.1 OmpA family [Spongiibacter sp. IMCC21906]